MQEVTPDQLVTHARNATATGSEVMLKVGDDIYVSDPSDETREEMAAAAAEAAAAEPAPEPAPDAGAGDNTGSDAGDAGGDDSGDGDAQ